MHGCRHRKRACIAPPPAGLGLHLGSIRRKRPEELSNGEGIVGDVMIDPTSTVGKGCLIGPNVSIGRGCTIGDGVRLSNCVILHRVKVKNYARVADAIVGWASTSECCQGVGGVGGAGGCVVVGAG